MKWLDALSSKFAKYPEKKFRLVFVVDCALLFLFILIIYHIGLFYINRNIIELIIPLILGITFASASVKFSIMMKQSFEVLPYTYKIACLFRRFVFLYEALIFASLTFLLGFNASVLSLFGIEDKLFIFSTNSSLIIASCIATSTKAMLDYAYDCWDLKHRANGDELVNDEL